MDPTKPPTVTNQRYDGPNRLNFSSISRLVLASSDNFYLNHHARPKFALSLFDSDADWNAMLGAVNPLLKEIVHVVDPVLAHRRLRPPSQGGTTKKAVRRQVLDIAAWIRDAVYVISGPGVGCTGTQVWCEEGCAHWAYNSAR